MHTKEEYLKILQTYFLIHAKDYGIERIGLFGSVARDEQTSCSDVDIAYVGKADILIRSRIKQELEKLFKCRVDLVRLRPQLPSYFQESIIKDLIYV